MCGLLTCAACAPGLHAQVIGQLNKIANGKKMGITVDHIVPCEEGAKTVIEICSKHGWEKLDAKLLIVGHYKEATPPPELPAVPPTAEELTQQEAGRAAAALRARGGRRRNDGVRGRGRGRGRTA